MTANTIDALKSVASDAAWKERRRRLDGFANRVFDTLKLALNEDITQIVLDQVKRYVIAAIDLETRAEMEVYTDKVDVSVSGHTHYSGWWRKKTTRKYIGVEVVFHPYAMHLSAWTDPKEPGGIVCFQ